MERAAADIYLNNPRGSNNKLNENNNNVNNANRLFDSENNGQGGYHVGDNCDGPCHQEGSTNYDKNKPGAGEGKMKFYAGSYLQLEWTAQHGCGADNPWNKCEIVIQYACEDSLPGIRDGSNTDTVGKTENNNAGKKPDLEESKKEEYGKHEPYEWYMDCKARERNKGLYTANQLNNRNDRQTAIHTRQNNNGNRHGFECTEERDYYPYWHPTPWRDVAVLTDSTDRCGYYQYESQNTRDKGRCEVTMKDTGKKFECYDHPECRNGQYNNQNNENQDRKPLPNNRLACERWHEEEPNEVGTWYEDGRWDIWSPECLANPISRINHHGNTATTDDPSSGGGMAKYIWEIPHDVKGNCALRIRYNITSGDFDGWNTNASKNNAQSIGMAPDPKKDWVGGGQNVTGPLTLNINTAQFPRTFEDRSHVFEVMEWPGQVKWPYRIMNFNVRGRRGNIVQVYPAVEYDFVYPDELNPSVGDFLHFQWTGSDASANNDGNGRQRTDRSNFVQMGGSTQASAPKSLLQDYDWCFSGTCKNDEGEVETKSLDVYHKSMFDDADTVAKLAFLQQSGCDFENENINEQDLKNCAFLNRAPAYFDGGLVQMNKQGIFNYISTRNNAFTNRGQKGTITIGPNLALLALLLAAGTVGIAGAIGGLWFRYIWLPPHVAEQPNSCYATSCCGRAVKAKQAKEADVLRQSVRKGTVTGPDEGKYNDYGGALKVAVEVSGTRGKARLVGQNKYDSPRGAGGAGGASGKKGGCCGTCCRATSDSAADRFTEWWGYEGARFRVVLALGVMNATMFGYGYIRHATAHDVFGTKLPGNPHKLEWYPFAKAGGAMLNLNCSLILIPVLRNLLSWLRTTPMGRVLPLDDNIFFHYMIAGYIAVGGLLHIVAHYADFVILASRGQSFWYHAFGNRAGATGHLILLLMLPMFATGFECVRRKRFTRCCKVGGYSIFWYFHRLWMPIMLLLWLHGPVFWIFNHWPLMLMVCEKLLHSMRKTDPVDVLEVRAHDGDLMEIKMTPASGKKFKYVAGQYVRILCPEIDSKEWHPFTLTSAPEQPFFSCHIRCRRGMDWVNALRDRLNPKLDKVVPYSGHAGRNPMHGDRAAGAQVRTPTGQELPTLLVDGPYGSASEEVFGYKTLILVGAGIGVTPFVSIMRSIVLQHKYKSVLSREQGGHAGAGHYEKLAVHFFWCCRNSAEFDSFKGLLKDEIRMGSALQDRFFFNLYLSGELEVTSDKVQRELAHFGQWTNLYTGRPNWNRIFGKVKQQAEPGEHVGVFFCGPTPIATQLKAASRKHTDRMPTTFKDLISKRKQQKEHMARAITFDFHKENF